MLPTRNRGALAVGALETVLPQLGPGDEIIVVDNGSSDGSDVLLEGWLSRNPAGARLIHQPEHGVSAARNAALCETTREVVCFIDDDERADPAWLQEIRRAWAAAGPRVGAVGGRKRLVWGAPRPDWLPDYLLYVINGADPGEVARRILPRPGGPLLSAGNLSVRASAVNEIGVFDVTIGARPAAPLGRGEEDDFQRRLAAADWELWYEPAIVVDHLVPPQRLTTGYFRAAHRQRALRELGDGDTRWRALPRLGREGARYALYRSVGRPEAESAVFGLVYAWTRLAGRRPGLT
ncbi:MAG: glycosyltransferase family 2 protein [Gaiellaceae bacterium]